jgi:hypothetical protein
MLRKSLTVVVVVLSMVLCSAGSLRAQGVVQNASKDAVKGAIKGAKQEMQSPEVPPAAKQITKSVVDGVAEGVPLVTSQMANQANVNRKAMGKVARQVTSDAIGGALDATVRGMGEALGKDGEGPLAESLVAATEKNTAAVVRGIKSEMNVNVTDDKIAASTEKIAAAAVRGAMSQIHFSFPFWSFLLAFVLGGITTLACGFGLVLLYIAFQKRRAVEIAEPSATTLRTRPLPA